MSEPPLTAFTGETVTLDDRGQVVARPAVAARQYAEALAPAGDAAWAARGDPAGRVVRGGSWHDTPAACRSAARARYEPGQGDDFVGFRVVCQ